MYREKCRFINYKTLDVFDLSFQVYHKSRLKGTERVAVNNTNVVLPSHKCISAIIRYHIYPPIAQILTLMQAAGYLIISRSLHEVVIIKTFA